MNPLRSWRDLVSGHTVRTETRVAFVPFVTPKTRLPMETPPDFRPGGLSAAAVATAFDRAAEDRRRQTPDREHFAGLETDYKYMCEDLHRQLASYNVNIDKLRSGIASPAYHEREARFLCDELGKLIFKNLVGKHAADGASALTLDGWRETVKETRRLLARHGVAGAESLAKLRGQIDDPSYWRLEADHLQGISALKEEEAWEKRRKARAKRERGLAKPKKPLREGSRRSTRLRERATLARSAATPTPAQPTAGRVTKQRGQLGA